MSSCGGIVLAKHYLHAQYFIYLNFPELARCLTDIITEYYAATERFKAAIPGLRAFHINANDELSEDEV